MIDIAAFERDGYAIVRRLATAKEATALLRAAVVLSRPNRSHPRSSRPRRILSTARRRARFGGGHHDERRANERDQ
ncbi:MAG: hypothetical protein ACT4OX_06450 [Actinomycetota bacterium]